ncbi:hypothetical protein CERSUDRAFT_114949 [Gelatoporia subvermispora B]|uniref:Mixed lineage kinase domain-containing protein n=1 Tax=Ceriporiopsis subvermispora (strain B) TaxID=914234 RepID=M2QJ37_CERS8|nr:hypothetical protein CERSUDRAFT_114949 [Gelatoporia subvermispora B]
MKFPLQKRLSTDDVLAHTITALQTLQGVSFTIGAVPFLGTVFSSAVSVLSTIEKVRGDKERSNRLAKRISNLLHHVEQSVAANPDAVDDKLLRNLASLEQTLSKIGKDLANFATKSASSRFLKRGSIAAKLEEHLETVEDASRSFNIASLIALRQKIIQQASYDEDQVRPNMDHLYFVLKAVQLRLFRPHEIQLQRVRGTWSAGMDDSGDEWDGEWGGRLVTVRVFRQEKSKSSDVLSVVRSVLRCPHPYVTQILGYSHALCSPSFYVLERATLNVLQYLANVDAFTKLRWYLQMHIDLKDAIEYCDNLGLTVAPRAKMHRCLPSLALKEDGTLFVAAEDLYQAHWGCLLYRIAVLFGKTEVAQPIDASTKVPKMPAESTRDLLSVLNPTSKPNLIIREVYERRAPDAIVWPGIYSSVYFDDTLTDVELGDYGYVDPQTQAFVRFGNVFELLRCNKTWEWLYVVYSGETVELSTSDYAWTEQTWRYPVEEGSDRRVQIEQNLRKTTRSTFFWFHACDIAAQNGIALEDLKLVETVAHCWGIKVSKREIQCGTPKEVYFHQLPLSDDDDAHLPFGFWSLATNPLSSEAQNELSSAGIELEYRMYIGVPEQTNSKVKP